VKLEDGLELNELEQLFGKCRVSFQQVGDAIEARVPLNLHQPEGPALFILYNTQEGTSYLRLVSAEKFEVDKTVGVNPLNCALEYDVDGNLIGLDLSGGGVQVG